MKSLFLPSAIRHAFTIVELLIVMVVIGIIASVTLISYSGISSNATNATIQSDLANADSQLKLYNAEFGYYPSSLTAISGKVCPTGNTNYCFNLTTSNTISSYMGLTNSYALRLTNTSNITYQKTESTSPTQIAALTCPTGFIPVPGSATYGTSDFCVAKYEAKCASTSDLTTGLTSPTNSTYQVYDNGVTPCTAANNRQVVSVASGYPIVNINQSTASSYSASACSGCQLITEAQWMTIAQNVLSVASNWSGGTVGSGYIYSGHNDMSPYMALQADPNDNNGYSGETNSGGNQRRTLYLSNGYIIWDMVGNVWDWSQGTINAYQQPSPSGFSYRNWTTVSGGTFSVNPYPFSTGIPGSNTWTANQGIGQINSSSTDAYVRGFLRGAAWGGGVYAGITVLNLGFSPSLTDVTVGFRISR